jgi:hypothetical protein
MSYNQPPQPPQPYGGPQSPHPNPPRSAPRWARKRYVLPALALAFFVGVGVGGPDNAKGSSDTADSESAAAAGPEPSASVTVTKTATATATATAKPKPAPTVTVRTTETVRTTVTAQAEDSGDSTVDSGDNGGGSDSGSAYYANCTAVRAAGAAPIRRGDAGYGSHLDRDGDGVACES